MLNSLSKHRIINMKKLLTILICYFIVCANVNAQNSFVGVWEGVQTNMQGYYPNDMQFELTANKEFLLKDKATNTVKYRGTYTVSGNAVSGKYVETNGSTSSTITFAGTFDAATKKLTCTYGYDASTRLGKWTMTQKSAPPATTATPANTPYIIADDSKYYLQVAKVTLVTGNDNKDKGAPLTIKIFPRIDQTYQFGGLWLDDYTGEIKKGEWWTVDVPRAPNYTEARNTLALYKKYGLVSELLYSSYGGPFPLTDAWKVDKVMLDLRFINYIGQWHPQFGNIHIEIPGSSLLFNKKTCVLWMYLDGYFKPLPSKVENNCN